MLPKERCRLGLPQATLCNAHDKGLEIVLGSVQIHAVQGKEDECRNRADALVPIDERMIPDDVEEVRRSHRKQVFVEVVVACACGWHGEGRPEQAEVPDSLGAPIAFNLVTMDLHDFDQFQE